MPVSRVALAALLIAAAPLAARAAAEDERERLLLQMTMPAPAFSVVDLFPQDMNSYQTGGWRDAASGDGTGGTVTASLDGTSMYMDGTINALAYAVRGFPDAHDFDMTIDFTIVKQQMTPDDSLVVLLRYADPTFPAGCCFGDTGEVLAASGLRLDFDLGRGTVTPYREKNYGPSVALAPLTPYALGFGQPHEMTISFVAGNLAVDVDGVPVGRWRTPNLRAGRVGLEVYRIDMTVSRIALTTR